MYQLFAVTIRNISLQFLYSLLQVYIVHRVSFIFHLNVSLMSLCTRGFGYLLCWPRGRGKGLVCTRRFSFHEFYNFLLFNFLIFISFCKTFFFTHDIYPHPHPRPTTSTHDPRPTTFSYTRIDHVWILPVESTHAYALHEVKVKVQQSCAAAAIRTNLTGWYTRWGRIIYVYWGDKYFGANTWLITCFPWTDFQPYQFQIVFKVPVILF